MPSLQGARLGRKPMNNPKQSSGQASETARLNPYAPEKMPFVALGREALEFLAALDGVTLRVALLWLLRWDAATCGGQYLRPVAFTWCDVEPHNICSFRSFFTARKNLEGKFLRRVKTGKGSANLYIPVFAWKRTGGDGDQRVTRDHVSCSTEAGCIPSTEAGCSTRTENPCSGLHTSTEAGCSTHGSAGEKGVSPEKGVSRGDPKSGDISSLKGKDPEYSTPEVETKSLPGVAPSSRRLADTPYFIWCKYIGSEDFAGDTPKAIAARLEEIASPVLGDAVGWNFRPRVVGLLERFGRYVFAHEAGKVLRRETRMSWVSFVEAVAQACAMQNEPKRVAR